MSVYNPPTFSEYLSVFNPANWVAEGGSIDTVYLDAHYAQYPVIQGSNYTLKNTVVQGNLTVNNAKNRITFTDTNAYDSVIIGDATTALSVGNPLESIFIGSNAGGNITSNTFKCLAIGDSSLQNSNNIATSNTEYYNTAVGANSLNKMRNSDNNTLANSGCGYSTLSGLLTGNNNSSLGSASGTGDALSSFSLTSGSNNTFLGAKSGLTTGLSGTCSNSTAVGALATISESNQIQLGTATTYVNIPNYIKYADGTTQSTALTNTAGSLPNIFISTSTANTNLGLSQMNCNLFYTSTYNGSPTVSLPYYTTGAIGLVSVNIYNTGTTNPITIKSFQTGNPQLSFVGKYGTNSSLLPVPVNSWVAICGSSTQNNWWVVDRGNINPIDYYGRSTSVDLIATPLTNSLIRIEPTVNISAYIPDNVLSTNSKGGFFTVENLSNTYSIDLRLCEDVIYTPSSYSTFTGLYGNSSNVLTIPPLSTYTIFVSTANTDFDVINRTPNIQTFNFTSPTAPTNIDYTNSQYYDTIVNLTGSNVINLTIPDARQSVYPNAINRRVIVNNNGSGLVSIASNSGNNILGRYGNRSTAITLPDNSSYTFSSNGTNWEINERSSNIAFRNLGLASTATYTNNYNYLGSLLYLSSTDICNISWLSATALNSHLTTTKVYNIGSFQINLNSSAGSFLGKYGSGSTSLVLPANTWVEIFSDGTTWLVNDRSAENQIYYPTAFTTATDTTTLLSNYQYANSDLHLSSTITTSDTTVSFPNANTSSTINQSYTIYNDNNLTNSNTRNIILSCSTSTFRGIGVNNGTPATTFTILPNQWYKIISNGTNWVVVNQSPLSGETYVYTSGNVISFVRPYSKFYYANCANSGNLILNIPQAQKEDVGTDILIKIGIRQPGGYAGSVYFTGSSTTNPIFIATATQPNTSGVATFFTSGNTLRMTCFQVGFAGSGTATVANGSAVINLTTMSTGGAVAHYTIINLGGVNYTITIPTTGVGYSGCGNTGTYTLTTNYTGSDTSVSYTINNLYAWFLNV